MCISGSRELEKCLQRVNESLIAIQLKIASEASINPPGKDTSNLGSSETSSSDEELITIVTDLKESFNTIQEKISRLTTSEQDIPLLSLSGISK